MKKILAIVIAILMVAVTFASCASPVDGMSTGDGSSSGLGGGVAQNPINSGNSNVGGSSNEEDLNGSESSADGTLDESDGGSDSASGENNNEISAAGAVYTKNGTSVTFGSYPQALVSDDTLTASLESKAGGLPSWSDKWKTCNGVSDMVYVDVEENGKKYRGIYFTAYRDSGKGDFYQDDNGYSINTAYWFEYQPITWTVLAEENGKAFILADISLDSQAFDSFSTSYASSSIKSWLNDDFYNTAFNKLQQAIIADTAVDGSNEKVFLLSSTEVTEKMTFESDRQKTASDYSKALGKYVDGSGNGWWLLRDVSTSKDGTVSRVKTDGSIHYIAPVVNTGGIVPALWFTLTPEV